MLAAAPEIPSYVSWLLPVIVIGILVQFLWSSIVTFLIYKLTKNDRNVDEMRRELTDANEKVITERFRAVTHSVNNHAQNFTAALDKMSMHVRERDEQFTEMLTAGPKAELAFFKEMTKELRNATSREEFNEFREESRQWRTDFTSEINNLSRAVVTGEQIRKILQEVRRDG